MPIRTLCDTANCKECGKPFYMLRGGLVVAAECAHAWVGKEAAKISERECEICGGTMICDESGQVVYWMDCSCFRDQKGMFANDSQALAAMNLHGVGAEFCYVRSQAKRALELQALTLLGLKAAVDEMHKLEDMFKGIEPRIAPAEDFRCDCFLICPKANSSTKRCKDAVESKACPIHAKDSKAEGDRTEKEKDKKE